MFVGTFILHEEWFLFCDVCYSSQKFFKKKELPHTFGTAPRATIFCIIEHMSGAHPVVAGVASVYVKGVLGRQTNLSCW
jgi:hypothetical protein